MCRRAPSRGGSLPIHPARIIFPSRPARVLAASAVTADIPESDDPDGDFLPTDWELLMPNGKPGRALDPADNGWSSATDGQLRDPDQDGLTNLDEFQLGTHPRLADTDGDGWSGKDERDRYRSNPLVSNAIQPGPLATIGLTTATALKAPVSGSVTGHLPTAADTAAVSWPAADPRLIGAATGTLQGSWIAIRCRAATLGKAQPTDI